MTEFIQDVGATRTSRNCAIIETHPTFQVLHKKHWSVSSLAPFNEALVKRAMSDILEAHLALMLS